MEVRPGYKQTEAGVIPEEWDVVAVRQLVEKEILEKPLDGNHGNIHPKSSDYVDYGIPFVMANTFANGEVNLESCKFITRERADKLQKGFSVAGDVLLTHKGTVGSTAIVGELSTEYIMLTPQVTYYRVTDANRLNNRFLRHYFDSPRFQSLFSNLAGGGTRAYLGIVKQLDLPIVKPPIDEQRAIAAALSDVDALLGGLERLIAKTRDLKQAAMQRLLTGRTRLPGFSGAWEVKRLGDVGAFCAGTYLALADYRDGEYEVQGAGSMMGHHDVPNFPMAVSVIGRVGTVGRPRFRPAGCWVNNNAAAIVARASSGTPEFVHLLLLTIDWSKATSVTAQPFLVVPALLSMEVSVPTSDEQRAIATVLSDMDAELAALEARRDKTRDLKQAMMQELLTGRTRLVTPEAAHA